MVYKTWVHVFGTHTEIPCISSCTKANNLFRGCRIGRGSRHELVQERIDGHSTCVGSFYKKLAYRLCNNRLLSRWVAQLTTVDEGLFALSLSPKVLCIWIFQISQGYCLQWEISCAYAANTTMRWHTLILEAAALLSVPRMAWSLLVVCGVEGVPPRPRAAPLPRPRPRRERRLGISAMLLRVLRENNARRRHDEAHSQPLIEKSGSGFILKVEQGMNEGTYIFSATSFLSLDLVIFFPNWVSSFCLVTYSSYLEYFSCLVANHPSHAMMLASSLAPFYIICLVSFSIFFCSTSLFLRDADLWFSTSIPPPHVQAHQHFLSFVKRAWKGKPK